MFLDPFSKRIRAEIGAALGARTSLRATPSTAGCPREGGMPVREAKGDVLGRRLKHRFDWMDSRVAARTCRLTPAGRFGECRQRDQRLAD